MIKSDATVIGVITRDAEVRTGKNGQPYLSITLTTLLQDRAEGVEAKPLTIHIQDTTSDNASVSKYKAGTRIEVKGELTIRKEKEDAEIIFFMKAESIVSETVSVLDSITGTMNFTGTIGITKAIEEKEDKNGNKYLIIQAYSSEKIGENFTHIWVRFMRFTPKEEGGVLRPDCIQEKGKVKVSGNMQLQSYKGNLSLSARADSIEAYTPSSNS